jgi:hypothetical protein
VAPGVTATGGREILGVDVGDSEDEVFWRGFLRTLRERGLSGFGDSRIRSIPAPAPSRGSPGPPPPPLMRVNDSDQHAGLVAALGRQRQGWRVNGAGFISPAICSPRFPSHTRT